MPFGGPIGSEYQIVFGIAAVLAYAIYGLCILFPFLVFFGFFENRKDEVYRFRAKRFLIVMVSLVILNLAVSLLLDYAEAGLIIGATKFRESNTLAHRTIAEYQIRNDIMMFPNTLDDTKMSCLRAASSHYVEDQWSKYFRDESCKGERHICADNETTYYDALIGAYDKQLPYIDYDLHATGLVLQSVWPTYSDLSALLRRIYHDPDDKGHIPDPPDERMIANYRHYLDTCASLKPLPWVIPGEQLLITRPHLCWGKCS